MAKDLNVLETEQKPAEQENKTRITTVSVRVKVELDAGYVPFIRYMKKTQFKTPPFGMRDATRATLEVFMSAQVGDDATAEQTIAQLSEQGHALVYNELRAVYPESFPAVQAGTTEIVKAEVPEEAFVIASTTVERTVEDF